MCTKLLNGDLRQAACRPFSPQVQASLPPGRHKVSIGWVSEWKGLLGDCFLTEPSEHRVEALKESWGSAHGPSRLYFQAIYQDVRLGWLDSCVGLRGPPLEERLSYSCLSLALPATSSRSPEKKHATQQWRKVFHISPAASQPLPLVCLLMQSPWQHEVQVDYFLYLWLAGLVLPLFEAYLPHTEFSLVRVFFYY